MKRPEAIGRLRRPSPTSLVVGSLVLLGFLLASLSWWFILLTACGTFGPGLLRELGWLQDKDELQVQAARRAGYHAFLASGFAAFLWMAYVRSGPRQLQHAEELATFFLALGWFTWFFSALVSYWGARRTAFRVLLAYGLCWLAFCILDGLTAPMAMLMQSLLTLPFFVGAFMARRWPRTSGLLLLAASAFFVPFFHLHRAGGPGPVNKAVLAILFIGPMAASSLALLLTRDGADLRG